MTIHDPRRDRGDEQRTQQSFGDEFAHSQLEAVSGKGLLAVQVRVGHRFYSVWWGLPLLVAVSAIAIVVAKLLYPSPAAQAWLAAFPAVPPVPKLVPGMPGFMRWTHLFNFVLMAMIVRSGLQILVDHPRLYFNNGCTPDSEWLRFRGPVPRDRRNPSRPSEQWTSKDDAIPLTALVGLPGGRHTIGIARHWHFLADILFIVNGAVFLTISFATGYWRWLVPTTWTILPDAVSCLLTYTSLHHVPGPNAFFHLNALQQLAYFVVIYVMAPLAILTGLAQSPAFDNQHKWYQRLFINRQAARSLHFLLMVGFVGFYAVHMLMVVSEPNLTLNLNHIILGINVDNLDGLAILLLVLLLVGVLNVGLVWVSWRHTRMLQRISNLSVGKLMDLFFDRSAPRVQFQERDISPYFWPNGLVPTSHEWTRLRDSGYRDYHLRVTGLVEHPLDLTLADLIQLGRQEQITMHHCIQGWSGIGKWGGLPFRRLIEIAKPLPEAEWVMFYSFGEGGEGGTYYDSHSLHDLSHPQSLLAYEMNGQPLPEVHGAPLRLRVENQLGFKQVKWIREIEFVRHFRERYAGQGGYNEDHEFYGYRDEI
jgi:methionine sulfoxide reductase catalytic subunit